MSGLPCNRVLVLDDDPGILSLLAHRLSELPIHLVECSELEAAETLLDHVAFSVLIVDLEVSELGGIEGMRVIRHAAAHFPETRIVILSGHVTPHACQLARAMGVSEVLEKPDGIERLVTLVRNLTTDPFCDPETRSPFRLTVIEPLEEIVSGRRISSVFQPIFRLTNNGSPHELFGVEALTRGPSGSILHNPLILFDYAVRKELVFQTDMLCLESALVAAESMPRGRRLFINTHPRALSHPDFVGTLDHLLDTHQAARHDIVLELTEQSAIVDTKALAEILEQARRRGVQVALDDFGEGSSNLHLVHDLRPEFLKITGRFCEGIERAPAKQAMVKSTVGLGRDLGMRTVMERVESDEELGVVRSLGVDYGQGFHLGRPRPAQELAPAWAEC